MENTMLCVEDFERYASVFMDPRTRMYFNQGSERENTLRENVRAFQRYKFLPRMLRNVESRDLSVTVLGDRISFPVGLAPTAYQRLVHPDGEIAAAKGAGQVGTVYTLSTFSNTSLEDVASMTQNYLSPLWMQVFVMKKREITERMIKRAEDHGFRALVLTVDTPEVGLQLKGDRAGFMLPPHLSVPNAKDVTEVSQKPPTLQKMRTQICTTLTWDDIAWIKGISKLPLVLKGILTAEDARLAVKYGASAIWVSNHGGRQLDGTFATIDVLSDVVSAVEGRCEVYLDGGIRWGSDVLKALALGARAVFIGRPLIWGLVHNGEEGVKRVLEILRDELDKAMTLSGCREMKDINQSLVINVSKM